MKHNSKLIIQDNFSLCIKNYQNYVPQIEEGQRAVHPRKISRVLIFGYIKKMLLLKSCSLVFLFLIDTYIVCFLKMFEK
jgi:hypothetical protein